MKDSGLERRAAAFIKEHELLQTGGKVLAGVSGGADSTCLLLILKGFIQENGGELFAVHVNHCIRGADADADEAFVRELCQDLDVPLVVRRADVPAMAAAGRLSLEEAGRDLRLRVFAEAASEFGCSVVATAHHRDDAAETLLMNIMRGCGPEGLKGLQPSRALNEQVRLVRPLLDISASEIRSWLSARRQDWREDLTNRDLKMTRNRVRLEALPLLEEIRPGAARNMLRMSALAGETYGFVERAAKKVFEEAVQPGSEQDGQPAVQPGISPRNTADTTVLNVKVLQACDPVLLPFVLRMAMTSARGDVKDITEKHLRAVTGLVNRPDDGSADLPGLLIKRSGGHLIFLAAGPEGLKGDASDAESGDDPADSLLRVELKEIEPGPGERYPEKRYTKWFDYDKIKSPVTVRHRQPGDYITLAGGQKKLLRRWFIDEKVPRGERDSCTVLAEGSHILWIVGGRMSEYYKTGPDTVRVLQAEAFVPQGMTDK